MWAPNIIIFHLALTSVIWMQNNAFMDGFSIAFLINIGMCTFLFKMEARNCMNLYISYSIIVSKNMHGIGTNKLL